MKKVLFRKISLWLPVILWAALIFHFSSGSVFVASSVYWQDFAVKKTGHVLLFGFLALFIYRALRGEGVPSKKVALWSVLLVFVYGATDEYHQMFTQSREARVRDVIIDGIGAALFVFLLYHFLPKVPKKFKMYAERLNLI